MFSPPDQNQHLCCQHISTLANVQSMAPESLGHGCRTFSCHSQDGLQLVLFGTYPGGFALCGCMPPQVGRQFEGGQLPPTFQNPQSAYLKGSTQTTLIGDSFSHSGRDADVVFCRPQSSQRQVLELKENEFSRLSTNEWVPWHICELTCIIATSKRDLCGASTDRSLDCTPKTGCINGTLLKVPGNCMGK